MLYLGGLYCMLSDLSNTLWSCFSCTECICDVTMGISHSFWLLTFGHEQTEYTCILRTTFVSDVMVFPSKCLSMLYITHELLDFCRSVLQCHFGHSCTWQIIYANKYIVDPQSHWDGNPGELWRSRGKDEYLAKWVHNLGHQFIVTRAILNKKYEEVTCR